MLSLKQLGKLIGIVLLCTFILAGTMVPTFAVQTKTLKVAFYTLDGFFEYDEKGNEVGYGVDLLDKITQYTGIKFEYVKADSWENTKTMLLLGEADIRMPGTLPQSPSQTLEYTQQNIMDTYYSVLALKDRKDLIYNDYEKISTLKIGISKRLYESTSLDDPIKKEKIQTKNLVFYSEYNECLKALKTGKVDAIITNIMDMEPGMKQLARFSTVSNYISMPIGDPYLSVINDALAQIKLDEPAYIPDLYKKWFPERVDVPLTKAEIKALKSLDYLKFSFQDGQGTLSRKTKDGTFSGFYPSLAKLICKKLDIQYMQVNPKRDKKAVVVIPDFYYDYNWAQEKKANITPSYCTINYYKVMQKGNQADEKNSKIAAVNGYHVTNDLIDGKYKSRQIVWCDTYEDCIEAVYQGKADATFVNTDAADYYLNLYRYSNLTTTLTDYYHKACFAVWGDETGLITSALGKAIASISSDEFQTLMIKSSSVKLHQNILTEWVHQSPVLSIVVISFLVALLVALIAMIVFMRRSKAKNEILVQATNAKEDFISRMNHDMRTPMNAIIGISNFGMESENLEESRQYHKKINQSGQYLLRLINDTLDMSKIEQNKMKLNLEAYNSAEFINEISQLLGDRANEKGINMVMEDFTDVNKLVLFDKLRLQQIFINLINNAIKFTPQGGTVTFSIESTEKAEDIAETKFTVKDTGIGMSEEFQKNMFEPFEQEGEGANNADSGTGLGLSIVKRLVELMDGEISCISEKGKGTTFIVKMEGKIVSNQVSHIKKQERQIDFLSILSGKHILLVEDHPLNAMISIKLLEKMEVVVEHGENGKIALEMFEQSSVNWYDGILMDIRMPVMDGLTATAAIRALNRPDAKTVPIIATTANAFDEDTEKSMAIGMNAHLSKPIDPQNLYTTLIKNLRKAEDID